MLFDRSRLLIRADGGPQVGTGHVMRMMALSQAFRRRGGNVAMVVGDLPRVLIRRLEQEKIQIYRIRSAPGSSADAIDTREIAIGYQPDWIALDGYCFDDAYQTALTQTSCPLLVMDDFGHASHRNAELVVNQNIYSPSTANQITPSCRLGGLRYALLRDEFRDDSPRRIPSTVKRVLVTFGGADPDNWTIRTLQVLSDMNLKGLVVDCVIGSCYGAFSELEDFRRHARLTLRVHKNVDRMSPLMKRADLAISAAGSTCYELARCGVPTIAIAIADNQVALAQTMHQRHAVRCVDHSFPDGHDRCENLVKLVRKLIHDQGQRSQLSKIASQLVDGRGAQRIVDQMASRKISLRPATVDDAQLLWQWRNDPEVRAVSFSTESIDLATHRNWLQGQLTKSDHHVWMAEMSHGTPIGCVRFQPTAEAHEAAISIIVDQGMRSGGIGAALIHAATNKLFSETATNTVLAQIKTGNVASERAFQNAGFLLLDPTVIKGTMASQYLLSKESQVMAKPNRKSA